MQVWYRMVLYIQVWYRMVAAESAQPTGKPEPLNLLNQCGIVGVELPPRNKGKSGTLPSTWSIEVT